MGQTISGPSGFASFLKAEMSVLWNHILLQLTGHCALWISSLSLSLAPRPPSAGFLWLLALASVCGPRFPKSPTLRSLHLPSAWYAQLPSEPFTQMSPLDVTSSLMCQRETHIRSSHPSLKQHSFLACLLRSQFHSSFLIPGLELHNQQMPLFWPPASSQQILGILLLQEDSTHSFSTATIKTGHPMLPSVSVLRTLPSMVYVLVSTPQNLASNDLMSLFS